MAKGKNQKLKLLYLLDYLRENTNFDHPATREVIEEYLRSNDISVERKTVYDDIAQLNAYGICIEQIKGKNGGYYCDSSEFELSEIKMLVDSVQSSKFITEKQSMDLIGKLEHLTNKHDAGQLHRQVVVQDRVKVKQTNVFANIDHIASAINNNQKIKFKYQQYNIHKELELKHGGKTYCISPLCLLWDNENYYLIGYDSENEITKNYRVDKMKNIHPIKEDREGTQLLTAKKISEYNKKVFGMYHGEEKRVTIRFDAALMGVVIDKFGTDIIAIPSDDEKSFTVTVEVAVSGQFYAWLCGFPGECEVLKPQEVRDGLKSIAEKLSEKYR